MKKATKIFLVLLCAVLLVAGSILGTLAYLTAEDVNTNTFTAGDVSADMDESDESTKDPDDRTDENKYHLIPGETYVKDPTIHIEGGSEDCYVFVTVRNDIADIESDAVGDASIRTQMQQNGWVVVVVGTEHTAGEVWTYAGPLGENTATVTSAGAVDMNGTQVDLVVFENFIIDDSVDNDTLAANATSYTYYEAEKDAEGKLVKKTDSDGKFIVIENFDADTYVGDYIAEAADSYIEVKCYVIQASGFGTALDAWNAEWGQP